MMNSSIPAVRAHSSGSTTGRSRNRNSGAGKKTSGTTNAMLTAMPAHTTRLNHVAHRGFMTSEQLHVLDEGSLVLAGQVGAVDVTAVAVARQPGVELPEAAPPGPGHVGDESHWPLVVEIVAAEERGGPAVGLME